VSDSQRKIASREIASIAKTSFVFALLGGTSVASLSRMTAPARAKSLLGRLASIVSEVHAGEGWRVLGMLTSLFLLLVCYYVLKTVREPLILAAGRAEIKTYAAGVQAAVLVFFVPGYNWLSRRVGRRGLVLWLVGFFLVNLELFYVLVRMGSRFV